MRPLRALLIFLAFGIASAHAQNSDAEIQWLIAIQGTVTEIGDGALSLEVPTPAVAFTDRPERRVSLVNLEAFAANAWGEDGAFRADPPNASVVDESNNTIAVITIIDFTIDDGIASLSVTLLEGALPAVGDMIALTIDAFPTAVNDQITD